MKGHGFMRLAIITNESVVLVMAHHRPAGLVLRRRLGSLGEPSLLLLRFRDVSRRDRVMLDRSNPPRIHRETLFRNMALAGCPGRPLHSLATMILVTGSLRTRIATTR